MEEQTVGKEGCFMKKYLISFCLFCILLLSGCSKKNTVETVAGTYKLEKYIHDYREAATEDEDKYSEKNIEAYLIITGDTYGYSVYQDKETNITAKEVKLTYKYSSSDAEKVTGIGYSLETNDEEYGIPGGYSEDLKLKSKVLSSTHKKTDTKGVYDVKIEYHKLNNSIVLEDLEKLLDIRIPSISYSALKLNTCFVLKTNTFLDSLRPYNYHIIEINGYEMTANLYYSLKENNVDVVERDIPVIYENKESEVVYIDSKCYSYIHSFPDYLYITEDILIEGEPSSIFYEYARNYGLNIDEYIAEFKASLN